MRKKLLSLFVVFCMLLGMVPAIFANEITDALGIKEEDVSMYVSEDTVLTENVEGLVLVTAPVRVTIDGAKLETGLVLAPSAGDATVTIANAADVNAVVVLSEATVTIEASAAVANIDVSAANADVEVAGTVGSITVEADAAGAQVVVAQAATVTTVAVAAANVSVDVAGTVSTVSVAQTAASAKVTVEQTATVSTVSVAGSNASVDVAGSVKTVTVAQTAASANINVEKSATVSSVNVAAKDVTIEVSGTVESVNVAESATGAQLVANEGANVSKVTDATGELEVSGEAANTIPEATAPAEDDETYDEPEDEHPEQDGSSAGTENQYTEAEEFAKKIKGAPLADWSSGTAGPATQPDEDGYEVTAKATSKKDITVTAKGNVQDHKAGGVDGETAKWIGIAIPKENVKEASDITASADTSATAESATTPQYYFFLIYYSEDDSGYKVKPLVHDNVLKDDDGNETDYTYYFKGDNAAKPEKEYYRIGVISADKLDEYMAEAKAAAESDTDGENDQTEGGGSPLDILAGLLSDGDPEDLEDDDVDDVLNAFDFILHIKYQKTEGEKVPETDEAAANLETPSDDDEDDDQLEIRSLDGAFFLGTVEDIIGSAEDAEDAEEAEDAEIDLLFPAFDLAVLPVPVIEAPAVEAAVTTEAPVEEPEEEAEPEETEETEDEAVEEAEEPEIEAEEPAED